MLSVFEQHALCTKIAQSLAARIKQYTVELGDLEQSGFVGLLCSLHTYDATRDIPFSWFATKRIKGEMLNMLDKYSEDLALYNYMRTREQNSSLVSSTYSSIVDSSSAVLDLAYAYMLDNIVEDEKSLTFREIRTTDETLLLSQVYAKVEGLPGDLKYLVLCFYKYGKSFSDISTSLGKSKSTVSDMHKKAIGMLKNIVIT